MKKMVWIVAGLVVLIGAVFLIVRNRPQESPRLDSKPAAGDDGSHVEQTSLSAQGQAGMPAPLEVSDAVLMLIDSETDYPTRLGAMRKLGHEISAQDIVALKNFLASEIPPDVKIPRGAYNSIRNDTYEVLLRQKELPEGLGWIG